MSEQIVTFLASQQLLTIATADEDGPWICNVYFASDDLTLYFLSMPEARHSVHIKNSGNVAFSTAWFDPDNMKDRKSVQGRGECTMLTERSDIEAGLAALKNQLGWEHVSADALLDGSAEVSLYRITPSYIKYWDDELLGEEQTFELEV